MTLIRIFALSLLLGSAVAGMVWFAWGVVSKLAGGGQPTVADSKDEKKEPARAEGKRA